MENMRPIRLIILLAVFIVVLTGIFIAVYEYYKKPADTATLRPDYVVTATVLQKEFENNETEASAKYINKIVEVTGKVSSVSVSESPGSIILSTDNPVSSVICTLQVGITSKTSEGGNITIRGECSGYLMDVLLNNCIIVK